VDDDIDSVWRSRDTTTTLHFLLDSPGNGMLTTTHAQSLALKAKLFRGFSDPSRLSILESLRDDARGVSELVDATGLSQSNVSNHLACLLDCGLVEREPQGRRVIYRLADERVGTLLALADELLEEVAQGVYVCPRYAAPAAPQPTSVSRTTGAQT
jgi:DNA-binding transcriptional ArsR family regulator